MVVTLVVPSGPTPKTFSLRPVAGTYFCHITFVPGFLVTGASGLLERMKFEKLPVQFSKVL